MKSIHHKIQDYITNVYMYVHISSEMFITYLRKVVFLWDRSKLYFHRGFSTFKTDKFEIRSLFFAGITLRLNMRHLWRWALSLVAVFGITLKGKMSSFLLLSLGWFFNFKWWSTSIEEKWFKYLTCQSNSRHIIHRNLTDTNCFRTFINL